MIDSPCGGPQGCDAPAIRRSYTASVTARRSDGDETAAARRSQDHPRGGITYAARLLHSERRYEMRSVALRGPEPMTVEEISLDGPEAG